MVQNVVKIWPSLDGSKGNKNELHYPMYPIVIMVYVFLPNISQSYVLVKTSLICLNLASGVQDRADLYGESCDRQFDKEYPDNDLSLKKPEGSSVKLWNIVY